MLLSHMWTMRLIIVMYSPIESNSFNDTQKNGGKKNNLKIANRDFINNFNCVKNLYY